jgi:beta-lactamase superfamily II metal-dependent hydrolase
MVAGNRIDPGSNQGSGKSPERRHTRGADGTRTTSTQMGDSNNVRSQSARLTIDLLPAEDGDCLVVTYGSEPTNSVVIDGGRKSTLVALRPRCLEPHELLVVTHIDADHIEGTLGVLEDDDLTPAFNEIWFNGLAHAKSCQKDPNRLIRGKSDHDLRSPQQGDDLSDLIVRRFSKERWNTMWHGAAITLGQGSTLPKKTVAGGLELTLLSPTDEALARLFRAWQADIETRRRRASEPIKPLTRAVFPSFDGANDDITRGRRALPASDKSVANGSSIAFLAEYRSKSALLLADAHARILETSLRRLLKERDLEILNVNALKLPHHGSIANLSDDWLRLVHAEHVLVSTSGHIHGHPDAEAIEMVVRSAASPVTFHFNYPSGCTSDVRRLIELAGHRVCIAPEGAAAIML